jgi:hypothetical protein
LAKFSFELQLNNPGLKEAVFCPIIQINETKPCEGFGDSTLRIITEWVRSVTTFLLPNEY